MINLRIPGPTPIPPEVQEAMGRQMFDHRGPEFAALIARVTQGLQRTFQTQNDVLLVTASGTGGLEAALVNLFSPGDRVLAVCVGYFGDRFADIAEAYGAQVRRLEVEWGQAATPAAVRDALRQDPEIVGVLVTHNETSTGVTNDLEAIAREVRNAGKLLVVDAISGMGSIPLPVDAWDCDVVVAGSQKGWMVPPGLAMVSVSPRAWAAHQRARMPRYYFDFTAARTYLRRNQTPFTPAIPIIVALDVTLASLEREGLEAVFERHRRLAERVRQGIHGLGLALFADPAHASNTVTAVALPPNVDAARLLTILREEHQVILAGGQQRLAGKIVRIGHLGLVTEAEVEGVLRALAQTLPRLGFAPAARR